MTYFLEITALVCVQPVRYRQTLVCIVHTVNIYKIFTCIKTCNGVVATFPFEEMKERKAEQNRE